MIGGAIEQRRLDGARLVALYGEHDLSTERQLRRELETALIGASELIVDLSNAEYIDSTVLHVLARTAERASQQQARFAIVAPVAGTARHLIELVGSPRRSRPMPHAAKRSEIARFADDGHWLPPAGWAGRRPLPSLPSRSSERDLCGQPGLYQMIRFDKPD